MFVYYSVGLTVLCLGVLIWYRRRGSRLPVPPGPPTLPIIGNLLDIPRKGEALAYSQMADKYGDIVYLSAMNKDIFVISSIEVLNELFSKRSVNYSDRPYSTMLNTLMDLEWNFAFQSYGNTWREKRKLFHSQFQESVVPEFKPVQTRAAHDLVRQIIASPKDLLHHLHTHVAAVLLDITYARGMTPQTAGLVKMAEEVIVAWTKVAVPGAYLVDALPVLRFIPEWLIPGGGFHKDARECKEKAATALNTPFETVVDEMAQGTARPSFVSNSLAQSGPEFDKNLIKSCAGTVFFAGTDAIAIVLNTFILAMVAYPDVQTKAQKELDSVVGNDRLPSFDDQESLPYVNAIVKEVKRWNPPAPLGVPHMTTDADQYGDYYIPAGSIVIGNLWKMFHNPEVFPDPLRFKPERFTTGVTGGDMTTALVHLEAVYGPGRRVCPGRFLAAQQLFITIATVLSVMELRPALDEEGKPIPVKPGFTLNLASQPLPFQYTVTPRGNYVHGLLDLAE